MTAMIAAVAVVSTGLIVLGIKHERLLSVQSNSMVPTFRRGDAIIVKPLAARQLRPGDIVSYRIAQSAPVIISHRLISVSRQTGRLTTRGDALHISDRAFLPSQLVGRVIAVMPACGRVLDALHRPFGLALAIYLPGATVIIAELRRLAGIYARPFYSVRLR